MSVHAQIIRIQTCLRNVQQMLTDLVETVEMMDEDCSSSDSGYSTSIGPDDHVHEATIYLDDEEIERPPSPCLMEGRYIHRNFEQMQ